MTPRAHATACPTRAHQWRGVIEEYRDWLPIPDGHARPSPCARAARRWSRARWLSELTGAEVWLKVEGDNPTGSFKDRGMTVALSVAVGEGAEAVVCASTGNTSASMAAYAARAGIKPLVLVPQGKIAAGKLAQAIVHGAQVIMVRGNFDDCLRISRGLADDYPVALVNSVNPMRLEGQKTASFEIVDFLGDAPDVHVLPVGNAGNISAYWKGYVEYEQAGMQHPQRRRCSAGRPPAPRRWSPVRRCADPETVASAIRIGNPASWDLAVAAKDESGGRFRAVTDEEILDAQRAAGLPRRRVRRAGLGRRRRRAAQGRRGRRRLHRQAGRGHRDRPRPQGHRHRAVDLHRPGGHGRGCRRRRRGRGRGAWRCRRTSPDRSPCPCRRRAPTSAPATTPSAWPSTSATWSPARSPTRPARRGRGRGRPDAVPLDATHLVYRSHGRGLRADGRRRRRAPAALRQPGPARSRSGLVVGGHRRRGVRGPRRWSPAGHC